MNKKSTIDIDRSVRNTITVNLANNMAMRSVKEVCELVGVTRKTLFYYDKVGLLKPTVRIGSQKQKMYSDKQVKKLIIIRLYRQAGYEIEEIKEVLSTSLTNEIPEKVIERNKKNLEMAKRQLELSKKLKKQSLKDEKVSELLEMIWED